MFGVVLAAHGGLGPALVKSAEAIVGPIDGVRAVTLESGASPETLRETLLAAVRAVDTGDGVLVFCDMFGGTPSNVCLSSASGTRLEVVTGVNLPMLLKLSTVRELPLEEAAALLVDYGQRHIANASQLLRERRRGPGGDAGSGPR